MLKSCIGQINNRSRHNREHCQKKADDDVDELRHDGDESEEQPVGG